MFSLKTTDGNMYRILNVLVRYYDEDVGKVVTQHLASRKLNIADALTITKTLTDILQSYSLNWNQMFLMALSFAYFAKALSGSYMKSTITQLERRFDIPSYLIGVVDGSFEIGCEKEAGLSTWIYVFLGNMLRGIGETPIQPLGISYVDDFALEENAAFYIGCVQTISIIGPVFGFLLGSLCAGIFVDVGFVEMDFIPSLKGLLGNPIYFLYLCITIVQFNSLIGMVTYKPKYIEQHYGQSASKANFIIGAINIPAVALGIFSGHLPASSKTLSSAHLTPANEWREAAPFIHTQTSSRCFLTSLRRHSPVWRKYRLHTFFPPALLGVAEVLRAKAPTGLSFKALYPWPLKAPGRLPRHGLEEAQALLGVPAG
ncbi:SO1C1 protein, partial [Polypterus senegalus]